MQANGGQDGQNDRNITNYMLNEGNLSQKQLKYIFCGFPYLQSFTATKATTGRGMII